MSCPIHGNGHCHKHGHSHSHDYTHHHCHRHNHGHSHRHPEPSASKEPLQYEAPYSPSVPKEFDQVISLGAVSVVETHAEGEACNVVIGGFRDVLGDTILKRQVMFQDEQGALCARLLNEPRGRCGMNAVFMLKPSSPSADRALLMAKNNEFVPISVSSVISAANVLAELPQAGGTSLVEGPQPRKYTFETVAGTVNVEANFVENKRGYLCDTVNVYNVPAFVVRLRHKVEIPGMGMIPVDIVYGGVFCAIVKATSVRLKLEYDHGEKIVRLGEQIKRSLQLYEVFHPEKSSIGGIMNVVFTGKIEKQGQLKVCRSATVVSPGRLDRSPSGTATSALLAVMHARGEIKDDETLCNRSLNHTEYFGRINGSTEVGEFQAIKPVIKGRAYITGLKHVVRDPNDPFREGFRGADQWGLEETKNDHENLIGLGLAFEKTSLDGKDYEKFNWDDRASTVFTIC